MIRSIVRAVKVPDAPPAYDTIFARITYPALYRGALQERNTGVLSADTTYAPFPVVIFMPGINVGKEAYQWLANKLAASGIVTVTYDWIAEDLPGFISLTAGIDLASIGPDAYGTRPTGTAIAPLLGMLATLQSDGVLAGTLDLDSVILGGHSAGATVAFQNTNPAWFPQVKGSFGFAGHTMAATLFGYAAGTVLPVLSALPVLIMGGTADGVIASSSQRYGLPEGSATAALERTFDEAIQQGQLAILDGASHFLIAHPHDETTGRGFLETEPAQDSDAMRTVSAEIMIAFIKTLVLRRDSADNFNQFRHHPLIVQWRRRQL
jgi:predicted dienelactone hydrolase